MPKFKVTYEVGVAGSTCDDDCHDGEMFQGTVEESLVFDAIDEDDANKKAKIMALEKGTGGVVSITRIE